MNHGRCNKTLRSLIVICTIIGSLILANVLFTMVSKAHFRSGTSVLPYARAEEESKSLNAPRGYIYDRNKEIIAQDVDTFTMYAILDSSRMGIGDVPAYVIDIEDAVEKLAPKLSMRYDEMMAYFTTAQEAGKYQTEFGLKGKNLTTTMKESIASLEISGIEFIKSSERFYPNGIFASNLIGYAQYDESEERLVGKIGLEEFMDKQLMGENGEERYRVNAAGEIIGGSKYVSNQAVDGKDVYVTIDRNVQLALEKSMEETMREFKSKRAWGVISEVETGKILGWAAYPSFDLNKHDIQDFLNVPSEYLYEPGSIMKGITYAAAIDSGNFPEKTKFRAGSFYMGIDRNGKVFRSNPAPGLSVVKDSLGVDHGTISFEDGFMLSSNIGICELLSNYLPTDIYENYLQRFGFFKEVDMIGVKEQAGTKNYSSPVDQLAMGYGQGSSVTSMQMMQAYSALFNDGVMMKPYYIDRVVNPYNAEIIEQYSPVVVGEPISKKSADKMKELMHMVVNEKRGTGYVRFHMENIDVIGKTGTGEISVDGKYVEDMYVNSFIGAAPAQDPKIMMYYVFESADISYSNGDYFESAFTQALQSEGILEQLAEESDGNNYASWKEYTMPSLCNHSLTYALEKLETMAVHNVIIGDGSSIVKQFPNALDTLITKQKVFLKTDGNHIKMPNMMGWTRRDVLKFAEMSGISFELEGFGSVSEQHVKADTWIRIGQNIKITLS